MQPGERDCGENTAGDGQGTTRSQQGDERVEEDMLRQEQKKEGDGARSASRRSRVWRPVLPPTAARSRGATPGGDRDSGPAVAAAGSVVR